MSIDLNDLVDCLTPIERSELMQKLRERELNDSFKRRVRYELLFNLQIARKLVSKEDICFSCEEKNNCTFNKEKCPILVLQHPCRICIVAPTCKMHTNSDPHRYDTDLDTHKLCNNLRNYVFRIKSEMRLTKILLQKEKSIASRFKKFFKKGKSHVK